ncbi:MAG: nodulation protein NfeD [Balneolaceae bacterium]|nr:nodulation protein NfeD [Balneolaceae bacterium]
MKKTIYYFSFFFLWGIVTSSLQPAAAFQEADSLQTPSVTVIQVQGTIGPTTTSYLRRALETANERGDEALIFKLDTPGGLLTSTQDMVKMMLASELPIFVYVSPEGGNAGSAGTFITLAAHIAAMAPTTTIGAASPVSMGGAEMDTVMQKKIFNYSESFIENIADRRNRNADWAISAVRNGEAITEKEALKLNVIDFVATDLQDLLAQADSTQIGEHYLNTRNASVNYLEKSLAESFFAFILRPEVMLILTLVSIYGIVGEITNPGAIVPGVAGVISLILLLYGVAALPINVAGFILIGLAIVLFVIEAFTPTFGILITGGAVSFFLGALMLFQNFPVEMQLSWYWLVPATILTVLFFGWIATAGIKAQFTKHRTGPESLIGKKATVVDSIDSQGGRIDLMGEYWNAVSQEEIKEGEWCEVVSLEGLTVTVKSYNTTENKET